MKQTHPFLIALIILLFGCTPTDYEEATVTNEPEAVARRVTSTPNPPTSTAEPSPTIIAVMQETPTKEVRNVLAREDNGTPRPTITRRPPTITLPPEITDEEIRATVIAIQSPREYDSYVSPDGRKRVEVIIHDCIDIGIESETDHTPMYDVENLVLVDVDNGSRVVIDEQVGYCGGLGAHGFEGMFWSKNGRFFYYTRSREGVPDGCGHGWFPPLHRYDSEEKTTVKIGQGERSPDGTKLAVWRWNVEKEQRDLVVWGVNSGEEIHTLSQLELDVDINDRGALTWSPDSKSFVYSLIEQSCGRGSAYLIEVNLSDLTQMVLVEVDTQAFPFAFSEIVWDEREQIIFPSYRSNDRTYNVETGELIEVSPDYYGVFDRILGRPMTTIEKVDDFPQYYNLLAYRFESAEIAAVMADAIQPNGTVIHYFAPDGTNARETIETHIGQKPYWWHVDDTIYLYMGWYYRENIVETISEQLDATPLNTEIERETIYFRIANEGDVPIETVTLDLGGGEAVYTDLFAGKKTSYQSVGDAADFGTMRVTVDGEVQDVVIEGEGEMLAAGNYTIVINVRNNGTIIPELILDGYSY